MPIRNREDAVEVEQHIKRIFDAPTTGRAAALRRLFVEVMDFEPASGEVALLAPMHVTLPAAAERVATLSGVDVIYVPLDIESTERVRKVEAAEAARLIANELSDDLLLVMTNTPDRQLHFIRPTFTGRTPSLRRLVIERDLPRRTAIQQLSNIYWVWKDTSSIVQGIESAFDVEVVTQKFFNAYKVQFDHVMKLVDGFGSGDLETEAKRLFVQTMFNRLMFVYFLSRKGWLEFKGSKDYLNALWNDHAEQSADKNFYDSRLRPLFFTALNNERTSDLHTGLIGLVGDPPFLNGGLFDGNNDLDGRDGVIVPDSVIEPILSELFDRFNFTVMESTPLDIEVAVDPEMLGKVFEELVTGRHESGSYYTPRSVVSFMCREALKGYLEEQDIGVDEGAIKRFVDDRDPSGLTLANASVVGRALASVTVVDPACGSGAYLVGMLHELIDLFQALYSANLESEPKNVYDLKLQIIERNLYGVDIDQFAVNIAMLRLWLSLAVEFDGSDPPPLPNLDFKVMTGDSLFGPDPGPEHQGNLFTQRIRALADDVEKLKRDHLRATGSSKKSLAKQIESVREAIRAASSDVRVPEGSVDWRVELAEVFQANNGFDIVVANPPYRRQEGVVAWKKILSQLYPEVYRSTADFHVYFFNRSIQLLRPGGLLAFITSNKYMKAQYGDGIRDYLAEKLTLRTVIDFGDLPVFKAASYPAIVIGVRRGADDNHLLRAADLALPVRMNLSESGIGTNVATVSIVLEDIESLVNTYGILDYPQILLRDHEWAIESPDLVRLFRRLVNDNGSLRKLVQGRVHRGVLTGLNDAFVIDSATRAALIADDPSSADLIKPWLRGADIKRWDCKPASKFLIAIPSSDDGNVLHPWSQASTETEARQLFQRKYPAIHDHLSAFESYERVNRRGRREPAGLRVRQDQGKWWWELRSCTYYHAFGEPKIVWPRNTDPARMQFASEPTGAYLNDKGYLLPSAPDWLLPLLNSSLMHWVASHLATQLRGGYLELRSTGVVDAFPIPNKTEQFRHEWGRIAQDFISDSVENREAGLDDLVEQSFGLTQAERAKIRTHRQSLTDYYSTRRRA